MIPPLPSTIVATVYIFLLTILACVQLRRSRTPLRLGATVMAVFGLSISVLSVIYATDKVSLSVFWVYQFVAECVAVTWVITTIIHLGYAFYPVTRHQTLIWRTALGSVFLYDLVAIAELTYYCYAVWGSGTLSKEATPVLWIYWVRQMVKVTSCAVTIAYLFVPLVRHHHNAGVAMIADSNTLAVGTWYLSALGVTSMGYIAMFIYFMVHPQEVFSMPAQALDLCLRLTACPIFSLPPPPFLLRYFHKKYGSTVRDDNPNTMIEEGITNNPRPRRPPLLVSHPTSYHSRRGSDFDLDYPTYPGMRSLSLHLPFPGFDDIQCKRFMDEEANIGTSSTLGTDTSPRLRPLSTNSSSFHKEAQTPTTAVGDDSIHTAVSVIPPLDAQSTSSTHGTTPPSPPSTFSPGTTQDRDEDEETAIAARNISRRLTMEGRRDGLDFLNIGNFIKWPHRSHSPVPEPKATLAGPSGFSTFGPLPTITPGSSPLNPNRNRSGPRSLSPSEPSRVSDICIREEDEFTDHTPWRYGPDGRLEDPSVHEDGSTTQDNEKEARRRTMDTLESLNDDLSEIHTEGHDDDAQVRSRASNATLNEDDDSHDGSSSSRVPAIGRRLSMENIRQMSRHALTRFHAGPIRTGLSISTPSTGPLSPTILRTNHGTNNSNGSDESRLNSPKSVSSNHGSDALEPIPNYQQQQQQQQQHTRSQQTHAVEPIVNPLNEESS